MIFTKLFKRKTPAVKLSFSSSGDVLADSNPFLFTVSSIGKASDKGFLISISGDAVNDGSLRLDKIELHRLKGVKFEVAKYGLKRTAKKDGGYAYQLSLKNFHLPEGESSFQGILNLKGTSRRSELSKIENEIQFKLTPSYSGDKTSEILIGVFPYENILDGAASKWVKVTPDKDYFKKIYENNEG